MGGRHRGYVRTLAETFLKGVEQISKVGDDIRIYFENSVCLWHIFQNTIWLDWRRGHAGSRARRPFSFSGARALATSAMPGKLGASALDVVTNRG
jgi:hypothetical protein